jgi:NAD(P)H-dependent FMN reductase
MDAVYPLLDGADAIAVASPVFFATVPAMLKMLIDRCQPYWARRYVLHEPPPDVRRPGAILIVGGGGDPFGSGCAVAPIRSVLAVLSVTAPEERILQVVGPDRPGEIACELEALEQAARIGAELVAAASAVR